MQLRQVPTLLWYQIICVQFVPHPFGTPLSVLVFSCRDKWTNLVFRDVHLKYKISLTLMFNHQHRDLVSKLNE